MPAPFINVRDYSPLQVDTWAAINPNVARWEALLELTTCYVAEIDGNIVGFGDFAEEGCIFHLYTHKDFQGRGIASQLLATLEEIAKKENYNEIYTESSITARPFFEKKGFRCEKEQNVLLGKVNFINYRMKKNLRS